MIDAKTHAIYRARIAAFEAWLNGRTSYRTEDVPTELRDIDNAMRSAVEVYEINTEKPEKLFVYVAPDKIANAGAFGFVTTWTGERLGRYEVRNKWRDNFGGERQSIRACIGGVMYAGTYFKSSGDYARLKKCKTARA